MKSLKSVAMLAALVLVSSAAFAHNAFNEKQFCDFIPENTLRIPETFESAGGLTEAQFNSLIDKIETFYKPVIASKGGTLNVKRLWKKSDTFQGQTGDLVNAFAIRERNIWYVAMFGGLARHPAITPDAFTLTMCHEVGHHLGGFPTILKAPGRTEDYIWASVEGQADLFATQKCAREIWSKDDNVAAVAQLNVPSFVKNQCSVQHKSTAEIALCERGAIAGKDLINLLWSLNNSSKASTALTDLENIAGKTKPEFNTPNTTEVRETLGERLYLRLDPRFQDPHPEAQCRLDTYLAGAICGASQANEFGATSATVGACSEEAGDKIGFRPRCWYKPGTRPRR